MNLFEIIDKQNEIRSALGAIAETAKAESRDFTEAENRSIETHKVDLAKLDEAFKQERAKPVNVVVIPQAKEERMNDDMTLSVRNFVEGMEKRALTTSGLVGKTATDLLAVITEENPMRDIASVFELPGDGIVPVPGRGTGAWGTEGATITLTDPALTNVSLGAFDYQGGFTLTDALLNSPWVKSSKLILDVVGATIGEDEGIAMFGAGAGASSPQGLFNSGTVVQSATTATVVLNDIVTYLGSLETKFRKGKEKLIFSPSVLAGIIGLKDATGKLELDSKSQTLNGIPYVLTSLAPAWSTVTLTKLMAFGDFKRGYTIADRVPAMSGEIYTVKMVPSTNSFATNVLFGKKTDGRVTDATAYKVFQVK